jgi:hypothetical protein
LAFNLDQDRTSRLKVCSCPEEVVSTFFCADDDATYGNNPIACTETSARPGSFWSNFLHQQ